MAVTQLLRQLLETRDQERRELARLLHSGAAQQIATLQLNLEIAMKSAGKLPSRAARALKDCAALAVECAAEIRRVTYELHPPLFEEIGLAAALRQYLSGRGIACELPQTLPRLRPAREIALFRIVEEALPRMRGLRLRRDAGSLVMDFDLRSPSLAMRARVQALGGRMAVSARRVRITVPLRVKAVKSCRV